uniref:Uncharacterized protein n=1 Tax=Tetranychus urticae TaxID=32264 RepID=T1KNP7_TETUR
MDQNVERRGKKETELSGPLHHHHPVSSRYVV